jgi:hypothetical protein
MQNQPTPYPEVNAVLQTLLSGVQAVLEDRFVGMYLYGSLASGDFDLQRSDIDFVVVTDGELPEGTVQALEEMHTRIWASGLPWTTKLEGSYVPRKSLNRYDPADAPHPAVNEGRFYMACHDSDWVILRHVLREQEVILEGPSLRISLDPVQPNDLRQAVLAILREWWKPMLRNPNRLYDRGYQPYAVLTMCRMLYTLEHGTIVSKPVAARWALKTLGERWAGLIESTLARPSYGEAGNINETMDFIHYTLEHRSLSILNVI